MMRRAVLALPVVAVGGCAMLGSAPAPEELAKVRAGSHALLLLRMVGVDQHGTSRQPLIGSFSADAIGTGWGDFDSGGVPMPWRPTSPSAAAWAAGWVSMVLPPGHYYLAILPPRRTDAFSYAAAMRAAPRWRIEVPAGLPVVYAGSLVLAERTEPGLISTLWVGIDNEASVVRDETPAATAIMARDLPELPPLRTRLAVRHAGPIRLGIPPP